MNENDLTCDEGYVIDNETEACVELENDGVIFCSHRMGLVLYLSI